MHTLKLCSLLSLSVLALSACGPTATTGATGDAADAGANAFADSGGPPVTFPDGGPGTTCKDVNGNPIAADKGPSYDDDGDCYCETAPCTGSSNPSCTNLQGGDCNDCDPLVSPSAIEVNGDGVDNNCDGLADDNGSKAASSCQTGGCPGNATCDPGTGLCQDDPDPNCKGVAKDSACEPGCDTAALAGSTKATDFAKSLGLCSGEVESAKFVSPSDPRAHAIVTSFGTDTTDNLNVPSQGATMVLLSTGLADTSQHDPGTRLGGGLLVDSNSHANPDKSVTQACGVDSNAITALGKPRVCKTDSDCKNSLGMTISGDKCVDSECRPAPPDTVYDYTELNLKLRVPSNASSFSYRFQYYSSEYPTYRCSEFNDTFLAELTSAAFNGGKEGNISFDANNHVVSVDNGFFQLCDVDDGTASNPNANDPNAPPDVCLKSPSADTVMASTGFDPMGASGGMSSGAGATMELKTEKVPVKPGETITLRFIIFDEGDGILDSSVLLDDFRWSVESSSGPVTQPPVIQ